ncbi:hypothetical protein, partial [Mesorhizobium sp. M8A.F.Ca.ET.218.01.1.1]|uniref:hypothetical protein n=1 Tax=Mesorhizobium sp. M8A.F.Ca.ET.218.01.1.1 TaxID=2563971 RepID=UPI001679E697
MVRAGKLLARAQLGEYGFYVSDRALHPLELRIGKALAPQRVAYGMIGDDAAVIPFGALIQLDGVIRDGGCLELFGDVLLHV